MVFLKILAIDPGNEYSAYCIMSDEYKLFEKGKLKNDEVMLAVKEWTTKKYPDLHNMTPVDKVVIERVAGMGMPAGRELFETCEWVGRFSQEAERNVPVEYIYRREEKLYICGDSRAKDANIRQALIDRFATHDLKNGRGTKANPDYFYGVKADIWAAISVATTYLDKEKEKKK